MKVVVVTPAAPGALTGNRTTALRWAGILRKLGHRVRVTERWEGEDCDLMVALHAWRSRDSILRFRREHPDHPLVVGLVGTDVYHFLKRRASTLRAMEAADAMVTLQPLAERELPRHLRSRVHVIYQSVLPPSRTVRPLGSTFEVLVPAHLRPVKDPLRAAMAARRLPADSRIRVHLVGRALSPHLEARARSEASRNPRFRWLGPRPRGQVLRLLARARVSVNSSRMEGGANAVGESIVAGTPVLASRMPGNVGLLGPDYRGYFPVGDTDALARLMLRCERDPGFLETLAAQCRRRRPLFHPQREIAAWKRLVRNLLAPRRPSP